MSLSSQLSQLDLNASIIGQLDALQHDTAKAGSVLEYLIAANGRLETNGKLLSLAASSAPSTFSSPSVTRPIDNFKQSKA